MAKEPKNDKKARPKLGCPSCGEDYKLRRSNSRNYDLEHDRYKCLECGELFFDIEDGLLSEEQYFGYGTSFMHPNESYEQFMEHENFD